LGYSPGASLAANFCVCVRGRSDGCAKERPHDLAFGTSQQEAAIVQDSQDVLVVDGVEVLGEVVLRDEQAITRAELSCHVLECILDSQVRPVGAYERALSRDRFFDIRLRYTTFESAPSATWNTETTRDDPSAFGTE
jgi:hypothetical protein